MTNVYDNIIIDQKNKQLEAINNELKLLSTTDTLTALGNRRYLEESVILPLKKHGFHRGSLTVLLLDIDCFKQYNDRYGHQIGDLCLQAIASVLSSFTKNNDFRAVRYGGEEFIIVMTGLSPDAIIEKAEQVRKSIASVRVSDSFGNETFVTASIGVSFRQSWESDFWETVISEADQALYQAKQNGRNQIVLFGK